MITRWLIQVSIACAVFWPLLGYVWHGAVSVSTLQAVAPAVVIFGIVYTAFVIVVYLRRTRAR